MAKAAEGPETEWHISWNRCCHSKSPLFWHVLTVSEGEGSFGPICVLQIQEIAGLGLRGDERARRNLSALRNGWLPMDLPKVHWKAGHAGPRLNRYMKYRHFQKQTSYSSQNFDHTCCLGISGRGRNVFFASRSMTPGPDLGKASTRSTNDSSFFFRSSASKSWHLH